MATEKTTADSSEIDVSKCQGWRREGGAFTLGPVVWRQCDGKPVVRMNVRQEGEETGDLPSCERCWRGADANPEVEIVSVKPLAEEPQ